MKFKIIPIFLLVVICLVFFKAFVLSGKLPIPGDTIVGIYHPFRDFYSKEYPRGIPFKNFAITDPVRQQYPWKNLTIDLIKKGEFPLWNQYSLNGYPLLANFQSGVFYPLNFLFFIFNFSLGWSLFILFQLIFASIFMYLYLDNLKLDKKASFLGGVVFAFCGFSISWLEWGNIINTALWLPLIFLAVDKIVVFKDKFNFRNKGLLYWSFVFLFSLISSFFAGHLQIFFYISFLTVIYFLLKWIQFGRNKKILLLFLALGAVFLAVTLIQWIPTLQLIFSSARELDQANWRKAGWFIPWQNFVQFIVPDFFGNPATLNYWGVWNYGEFIGYAGILTIIVAFYALFFRHDKKTLFFGTVFFTSIIFAYPSIIAKIPFKFHFPFLSTAQPTRLIFVADFALSILAALGFDYFIKTKSRKKIIYILLVFLIIFAFLWGFICYFLNLAPQDSNLLVTKQNLILPTILFFAVSLLLLIIVFFVKKGRIFGILTGILILILIADLFRFGWKYIPFTNKDYLFPDTKILAFLKENAGNYRIMATDSRILPPNFTSIYKIQSLDGYDPLYPLRYGEFMAALGRDKPDISSPFGFNRIITPQYFRSDLVDLLGVKYVLSFNELSSKKFKVVLKEGETILYENKKVFPRAFFVKRINYVKDKQETIDTVFKYKSELREVAVVEDLNRKLVNIDWGKEEPPLIRIVEYKSNSVVIEANNKRDGFLVLSDNDYPTWRVKIDGKKDKIYRTDYALRGIIVPKGKHMIVFYNSLF